MTTIRKVFIILVSVLCVAFVGFFINAYQVNAEMVVQIKTYQVEIDTSKGDAIFFRGLITRDLPSKTASTVTIEYTINSSSGGADMFSVARGMFYGISYPEAGTYKKFQIGYDKNNTDAYNERYFEQGASYKIEYNLNTLSDINITKFINGTLSTISLANEYSFLDDNWKECDWHFGFGYRQAQDIIDADKALRVDMSVKCYDDTGKDLGLTFTSVGQAIKFKNSLVSPEDGSLTTFSKKDILLSSGVVGRIDGDSNSSILSASLNPEYASFVGAMDLGLRGANGAVLKLSPNKTNNNPYNHMFRIEFAKPLTKSQIEQGYDLVLNLFVDTKTNQVSYINLFAPDVLEADRNNSAKVYNIGKDMYEMYSTGQFRNGFAELTVPNSELSKIVDSDGNVSGFTIMLPQGPASTGVDFDIYLDNAKASHPEHEIYKEDYAKYANVYSNGNEIIALSAPDNGVAKALLVSGNTFMEKEYFINRKGQLIIDDSVYTISPTSVTTNDKTYFKVQEDYTVTLHYNDSANTTRTLTIGREQKFLLPTPKAPKTETGKTFKGWYYGDGTKYSGGPITTAISLYAKWEDDVKYNSFGGKEVAILVSSIVIAGVAVGSTLIFVKRKKIDR